MRCVRIYFEKTGLLRFVSHLDLMRCFTRAVRRAAVPIWYTQGFNPHPYLNFLAPLPLGCEGRREILDIRIDAVMTDGEIMRRLNGALPQGLKISAVSQPLMKPAQLCCAEYTIELCGAAADVIQKALASDSLWCEKIGKVGGRKQTKRVNVSESIKSFSAHPTETGALITAVLSCSGSKSVNPNNLIDALEQALSLPLTAEKIVRERLLDSEMREFE